MKRLLAYGCCILCVPYLALAATHVVTSAGDGDFPTIQAAVDAARTGDSIELEDGIYTGDGNRDVDLRGKHISIRSRSGSPGTCVIDCQASEDDLHRGFLFLNGESTETVLKDITVRGAVAMERGAAVLAIDSSPTISGCRFVENMTLHPGGTRNGSDCLGGAVALVGSSSTLIENCVFEDNVAGVGGGGLGLQDCRHVTVTGCRFERCSTTYYDTYGGGGIALVDNELISISDCVFRDNRSVYAGGAIWAVYSSAAVSGCEFHGNYAHAHPPGASPEDEGVPADREPEELDTCPGGGGAIAAGTCTLSFNDCTFRGNRTRWAGGALGLVTCPTTITNCRFVDNSTDWFASVIFNYSRIPMYPRPLLATMTVTGCTIVDNVEGRSVIFNGRDKDAPQPSLTLEACTITRNEATLGIIQHHRGELHVRRTMIAHNRSAAFTSDGDIQTFECSNVFDNVAGDWVAFGSGHNGVNGNISEDPLFCDAEGEAFAIAADSPCANGHCGLIGAWKAGCTSSPEMSEVTDTDEAQHIQ